MFGCGIDIISVLLLCKLKQMVVVVPWVAVPTTNTKEAKTEVRKMLNSFMAAFVDLRPMSSADSSVALEMSKK